MIEISPASQGHTFAEGSLALAKKAVTEEKVESATDRAVRQAEQFAASSLARAAQGQAAVPRNNLRELQALGLMTAPLPIASGGAGLGSEAGGHLPLLRVLAAVGSGDLATGRLYEGHVNALLLITRYGTAAQLREASRDAHAGLLFGVWNTGAAEPMRIEEKAGVLTLWGKKTFASGAPFVQRPLVTAEYKGWQMFVPKMDSAGVKEKLVVDASAWKPMGMEASDSHTVDFTGAVLQPTDLIGAPGDFYRDPMFRGGAIRFAAVQAGGVQQLHRYFAEWLESKGRGGDPYQVARLGEIALGAQESALWIERAATIAEDGMSASAGKLAQQRMVECANMTRVAIERLATAMMTRVVAGVGAHGLLQPAPFANLVRDLTMYLRQPAPDGALADIGRASLTRSRLRHDGANSGLWAQSTVEESLPATYFDRIYAQSDDPWKFRTSGYEAAKYAVTLASLSSRYGRALEIGCSIGVLTEKLASRCQSLVSVDLSEAALAQARKRCAALPQVRFEKLQAPRELPEGEFDLVVISEVGYYWQRSDVVLAAERIAAKQPAGAHVLLVHFTVPVADYPLTGDEVHEIWNKRPEWRNVRSERHERYRLDLLQRLDA